MIDALNHELITWLGYLQRGSVLLQLAILLITVMLEKRSRLTRRLNSELMRSVSHLIAPGASAGTERCGSVRVQRLGGLCRFRISPAAPGRRTR